MTMFDGSSLRVGDRIIGNGEPCFIIAEVGINHNGSLDMALNLVDLAAEAGADAVKFQKRKLDELYPPDLLDDPNSAEWAFQYLLPVLKQSELTEDDFRKIKNYCDNREILFLCTPWDMDSLGFLEELNIDAYKVASADIVNLLLIDQIVATGKPLIISTGMASFEEIKITVNFLKERSAAFALLHCISTYPAPFENLNLRFIETLKQFSVPVGYSSHERGIAIPLVALMLGSCIIEKHITLDRSLPGPDHAASLEPQGIKKMIRDIRIAELALGSPEKTLSAMERLNRQVLRKSLVAAKELSAGTVITRNMIEVKGPGKGLSPQRIDELLGKTLHRPINKDEPFIENDIDKKEAGSIPYALLKGEWGLKARFYDLAEILEHKPRLVELHLSEEDVDFVFSPPTSPYLQRLFIHAPEFADSRLLDLCSLDDKLREQAVCLIQRTIDKAVKLRPHFVGPVGIVIHVGGMSMDEPIHNRGLLLQRAVDAFKQLDSKGTLLLPENLPPRPWYLGGQWYQNVFIRPEEMIEFCQELDVRMTLDISHAQLFCNRYDESLENFVKQCLPYTAHLHISDAIGIDGEGLQIGEGVVEWEMLLDLLSTEKFSWVPEIWSGHLNNSAGFIEAINKLSKYHIL